MHFNVHDETMHKYAAVAPLNDEERHQYSHFNGWDLAVERNLSIKKNLQLSLGVRYTKRTHIWSKSNVSLPFSHEEIQGLHYHHLSIPATLTYTKGRIFKPYLTLEVGRRIGTSGSNNQLSVLSRPIGIYSFSLKPGLEVAITKNISATIGLNFTNYDLQARQQSSGFQLGLKIRF